jgi:hypothetical protein
MWKKLKTKRRKEKRELPSEFHLGRGFFFSSFCVLKLFFRYSSMAVVESSYSGPEIFHGTAVTDRKSNHHFERSIFIFN